MARVRKDVGATLQTRAEDIAAEIAAPPESQTVLIEVPLAGEVEGNIPHFVEVALRSPSARAGLVRLRLGLARAGTVCNGRPVESNADAVRALLELLGDQA